MMLLGNIVFMNFLIAVVNQSYEACMQRMKSQKFKGKFSLLVEKDKLFQDFFIVKKNKEIENEEEEMK